MALKGIKGSVKKAVLKNFENSQVRTCVGVSLIKGDSDTGVFLQVLQIFEESFLKNISGGCFWIESFHLFKFKCKSSQIHVD